MSILSAAPTRHKFFNVSSADVTEAGLGSQLHIVCCLQSAAEKVWKTHNHSTGLWMRVDLKRIWSQWLPAYNFQPTTERRELLRLGVRYDSSQSLLPVLQLTCLQYVVPVFHHHCTNQLQQKKNIVFNNKWSFYYYLLRKNPHIITLVILLCVCVKYFFWVFSKSSGPPAIARIMLSAIRLSWRQSSTAPSKFPVSRACVMSPSTSDRQAQMYFKFVTKCDVHSH